MTICNLYSSPSLSAKQKKWLEEIENKLKKIEQEVSEIQKTLDQG